MGRLSPQAHSAGLLCANAIFSAKGGGDVMTSRPSSRGMWILSIGTRSGLDSGHGEALSSGRVRPGQAVRLLQAARQVWPGLAWQQNPAALPAPTRSLTNKRDREREPRGRLPKDADAKGSPGLTSWTPCALLVYVVCASNLTRSHLAKEPSLASTLAVYIRVVHIMSNITGTIDQIPAGAIPVGGGTTGAAAVPGSAVPAHGSSPAATAGAPVGVAGGAAATAAASTGATVPAHASDSAAPGGAPAHSSSATGEQVQTGAPLAKSSDLDSLVQRAQADAQAQGLPADATKVIQPMQKGGHAIGEYPTRGIRSGSLPDTLAASNTDDHQLSACSLAVVNDPNIPDSAKEAPAFGIAPGEGVPFSEQVKGQASELPLQRHRSPCKVSADLPHLLKQSTWRARSLATMRRSRLAQPSSEERFEKISQDGRIIIFCPSF